MPYIISAIDTESILMMDNSFAKVNFGNLYEHNFSSHFLDLNISRLITNEGYMILNYDAKVKRNIRHLKDTNLKFLNIVYIKEGQVKFQNLLNSRENVVLTKGMYGVLTSKFFENSSGMCDLKYNTQTEVMFLIPNQKLLKEFVEFDCEISQICYEELNGNSTKSILKYGYADNTVKAIIENIELVKYRGRIGEKYIQTKIDELLLILLSDITCSENVAKKAKKILLSKLTNPPTIEELSKTVGISSSKLKKDFKIEFGKSIREVLFEERMYQAKALHNQGITKITKLSKMVGYSNSYRFKLDYEKFFSS